MDAPSAPDRAAAGPELDPAALRRLLRRYETGQPEPWLHGEIARRMAERLALIRRPSTEILEWWPRPTDADALALACPQARRWIATPAGEIGPAGRADAPWWRRLLGRDAPATPAPKADLLWANLLLHWHEDLPALLGRWHAACAVDAILMFSCYGPDTLKELQAIYRAAGWGPAAGPLRDMHDIGDALVQAGFADPVMDMETLRLSWPDADALLAELRTLGLNLASGRHAGLRTPRWRARLKAALDEALRGPDGRLTLSFEIVYGHALRPAPRPAMAAQTTIALEAMREMTRRRNP